MSKKPRPILRVENLSVDFSTAQSTTHAVKGVSFQIHAGETVALVGESGSGKSTTAQSILRLLPYPIASHPTGSIRFKGTEMLTAEPEELNGIRGNRISMIFQEPMTSLNPLHTVEKQIGEILSRHQGISTEEARPRVCELLEKVGLDQFTERLGAYPHQLSGGQRQRVMIAMALANKPDILIADEPTTALDVTVQAQILLLLKELQAEYGMSILLITHDLAVVRKMADRVCVMRYGKVVETGATSRVFSQPNHAYTKELLASEPKPSGTQRPLDTEAVIEAKDVKVWFPIRKGLLRRTVGHTKAVDGLSVTVHAGRTLAVVGESGSGKTTLAMALLRLQSSTGDIKFGNTVISGVKGRSLRPLRKDMQVVFQDPFGSLSPRMSVGDIIAEGLDVHEKQRSPAKRRAMIEAALEEVGLPPAMADRYPHEFSGGQRQRISIARAMALKPRFLVLDEPTSALDMSIQSQIITLLRDLQDKYQLGYLFISHDLKVVRALADEILVMRHGNAMEYGPANEVFDNPQSDYTKSLLAAAFDLEVA